MSSRVTDSHAFVTRPLLADLSQGHSQFHMGDPRRLEQPDAHPARVWIARPSRVISNLDAGTRPAAKSADCRLQTAAELLAGTVIFVTPDHLDPWIGPVSHPPKSPRASSKVLPKDRSGLAL